MEFCFFDIKMLNIKFKGLIILVSYLISAPAALAWISLVPNLAAERIKSIHTFELDRESIVVAENKPQTAESESQSTNENKDQAPSSETADREKSGRNSNDTETKPLKPFKPSEEIAADQAVDFPADI